MEERFISTENKSLIWQILSENKAFQNIDNSQFNNMKNIFEENFHSISKLKEFELVEKNKIVMSKIMKDINFFKSQNVNTPLQEVKIEIDNALKNKQDEFIHLIRRPTPEEIKFTDEKNNGDDPLSNDDMDQRLDLMMKSRQLEIPKKNDDLDGLSFYNEEINSEKQDDNIKLKSILKKPNSNNDELIGLLNKILANQQLILEKLPI